METQLKRHEPLYLKHRPQALDQLVGQEAVTRTLSNAINYDRLAHAYLFTGPRGTGKTSSARILAKSLNCKAGDKATTTPCQQCVSCLEITQGNSPAVFEIDAASNNSVDDARVLIERAPLVAPGGRFKIYIIDECHMLTKEAFNALLKTIEDPPPNVVFVLATTEEHKVIPTIVSRCQRLMFRLVTQEALLAHLRNVATMENIEITDRAIDFIARRSGGGLRDALGLLDQASLLSAPGQAVDVGDLLSLLGALHEDVLLEMSEHALHRRGNELLGAAAKLLHEGREPSIVVQELARHFLNLTKASYLVDLPNRDQAATEMIIGSPSYIGKLYEQAPQFERSELTQMVESLDRLEQACRRSTQPAMHLEVGLLALCHRQDMLLVRELADRVAKLEHALSGGAPLPAVARPTPRPAATQPAAPQPTAPQTAAPQPAVAQPAAAQPAAAQPAAAQPAAAQPMVPAGESPRPQTPTPQPAPQALPSPAATATQVHTEPVVSEQPPQVQSATILPEPSPQAPRVQESEPSEERSGGEASPDEVDRVWSQSLDELQRRHIPTFSLASVHAIPLSLTDRELTLGTKENFVKTLEMKVDHIKAACSSVVGKPIAVRIRAVTMDAPAPKPAPKQAPREQRPAAAAPAAQRPSSPDPDDDYEPEEYNQRPAPTGEHSANTQPAPSADDAPNTSNPPEGAAVAAGQEGARPSANVPERGNDGTIIKEAYKLFEGPGSRQIGDKK